MPYIIDDSNFPTAAKAPSGQGMGCVPRDMTKFPKCWSTSSVGFEALLMPTIPRNEYAERIREKEASRSRISDYRRKCGPNGGHMPSLDQNGQGYCWFYSATMCLMLVRALMNLPYVRLSAHMGACLIKNFRDQGGWSPEAIDFIAKHGVASVEFWPEKSMSRSNDNEQMRDNAAKHKVTEMWVDLESAFYDQNLSEDQACTCLLSNIPITGDFYHWGHSVALMDVVMNSRLDGMMKSRRDSILATDFDSLDLSKPDDMKAYQAAFSKKGVNSWTDNWGDLGEFTLEGSKAILNGGGALLVTIPSVD